MPSTGSRPTFPYFISYARADHVLADDLLCELSLRLHASSRYAFSAWRDTAILPGEHWRDEIEAAIATSRFGLLLVSYNFLASPFILTKELPRFIDDFDRRAIPVGLSPVDLSGRVDLQGLEDLQLYRDPDGKCFGERRGPVRDRFVDGLFLKVLAVVDKYLQPRLP